MNLLIITLLILLVIISSLLVWINFPGTFLFLGIVFLFGLYNSFDIITKNFLLIALVVCILLELIEFLFSALTIKIYGGKNSSALLSIAGGFIGAIIGSFIFPVIGSLFGLILGSYLTTYYNEKREGKTNQEARKIAGSSTLGYIFSKGIKSLGIIIFGFYIIKLFLNN